jgi:nicotinamidase-related amidase
MKKVHLVVIDPQFDFCDPSGNLYVKGADKDMERLGVMIEKIVDKIDDIHITLDSHHPVHIAHPIFWRDSKGNHPNPFTLISVSDVENGVWSTTRPGLYKQALNYVKELEKNKRYVLCIWPPHCLIGTKGQTVYEPINRALAQWTDQFAVVDYVTKGSNILTEHYSAIVADVPDPSDPTTQMNVSFLNTLNEADIILLAGEAGSHCLANTGRDAINYFTDDSFVKKLVLLEDATSPVPGFEGLQEQFIKDMTARGMSLATTQNPL